MNYIYRIACISLGLGLVAACDHEQTTPRKGEDPIACGGFAGIECPGGLLCIDDPSDDCDPKNGGADCGGICVEPGGSFCGGFGGIECPEGQVCVDDPGDDCDPDNGGADCGGICESGPISCGGFGGFPCPDGLECVDDPSDDCDPNNGGADCIGICEPAPIKIKPPKDPKPPKGDKKCKDPDREYVSHDPNTCMLVKFMCAEGTTLFSDECGCGCEK
jgi:hypothetical protein